MIRSDRLLILAVIIAILAMVVWGMTLGGYPTSANVFPAIAAGGVLLFGLLALREDPPKDDDAPITLSAVLWLVAVLPLIYLFGFRIALPLYAFVFALARRTGPLVSILLALAISAVVEILFVRVLGLRFGWGWIAGAFIR